LSLYGLILLLGIWGEQTGSMK